MKIEKLMRLYIKWDSLSMQVCAMWDDKIYELYLIIDWKKICFQSHSNWDKHWIWCKEIKE